MKKIISLFQRNYNTDHLVRDEVVPGAEWVVNGEGVATRKWDGTCVRMKNGKLWKRLEVKKGKIAPIGFEPAQEADMITGDCPGWVLVGDSPEDKWHREALALRPGLSDGTYELCGPKINGNPEKLNDHVLIKHGDVEYGSCPRTFNEIREYLRDKDIEGIVWWHEDGRKVKIKKKDFGMKR